MRGPQPEYLSTRRRRGKLRSRLTKLSFTQKVLIVFRLFPCEDLAISSKCTFGKISEELIQVGTKELFFSF